MIASLINVPSETKIKKELRRIIFGKHMFCPGCRKRNVYAFQGRYRCRPCRKSFSLLSGTWLSNCKLSLRTIWALLWCWTQQIPVQQTAKLCHVSEVTIYHWFRVFRRNLPDFADVLEGVVQMDEAYFKHWSLLMAKQVGSTKIVSVMVPQTSVTKQMTSQFLFQNVAPRSQLQTDGSGVYRNIEKQWQLTHRKDIHAKWQFGLTSEIEGMFANLRTFIRRMYHHVTPEYLPEYVGEFCVRFSHPEMFTSPRDYLSKTITLVPTC
jgi:transposase-like protein